MRKQSLTYVTIFRDGQDTDKRDFSFQRNLTIKYPGVSIVLNLNIDKDIASVLSGEIRYDKSDVTIKNDFSSDFCKHINQFDWKRGLEIFTQEGKSCGTIKPNEKGVWNELKKQEDWKTAKFSILLSS